MSSILTMFRKSPFEPLYQHRDYVRECVLLVKSLLEAVLKHDLELRDEIALKISDAERKADEIKVEIRRILPSGIFLAVNREDLLRYLKIQDNLADTAEDIAVLASMKDLSAPEKLSKDILNFVDTVLNVCQLSDEATNQLKPLVSEGFKGGAAQKVLDTFTKVEQAERVADDAGLKLAKRLFEFENEMSISDIFLWFRIFDKIGDLADYADSTGEVLSNMLSR